MRLLFVCVENSCRSQMAEGWARHLAPKHFEIISAGSRPAAAVHPLAVQVMRELGVDISRQRPKPVPSQSADYFVSMGCGDACPSASAAHRVEWQIPDPKGREIAQFRAVRDLIGQHVSQLLREVTDGTAL